MNDFITQLVSLCETGSANLSKSSFIDALIKAGTGEGSRGGHIVGHTASGKPIYESSGRKPYPGEESHNLEPQAKKQKTYMPVDGSNIHYSDPPELQAYKTLLSEFKRRGMDFQGHITFDPKSGKISAISPKGAADMKTVINDIMTKTAAKTTPTPKLPEKV